MRRIAPLLLTLTVLCAVVPTAHAAAPVPPDDAGRLALFLPIARAAWPASPCAGREVVHLASDAVLDAQAPEVAGPGGTLDGLAEPETCDVWMAGGLTARTFCTVLVHELGHLAGLEHTTVPGDVMNGAGDIDYAPCDGATAPSEDELLERDVRSVLPAPRAAWRIACTAPRGTKRRCVARRGRAVRRYEVKETPDLVTVSRLDRPRHH